METSSESLNELSGMNPLQLSDIAQENSFLDFDWQSLDSFFAEGSVWSSVWV